MFGASSVSDSYASSGSPTEPKCGFSRKVVEAIRATEARALLIESANSS
jgi:glutaredoxin-related protein